MADREGELASPSCYASETANRVTNRAIQIHGGRGMTPEYLVEKLWRDAKSSREIGEGCSEIPAARDCEGRPQVDAARAFLCVMISAD